MNFDICAHIMSRTNYMYAVTASCKRFMYFSKSIKLLFSHKIIQSCYAFG